MANWKFGRRQNIQNQHLYYITIKKQAQVRPNSNTPLRKQGRASREPQNFGKQAAPTPWLGNKKARIRTLSTHVDLARFQEEQESRQTTDWCVGLAGHPAAHKSTTNWTKQKKYFRVRLPTKPFGLGNPSIQASSDMIAYQNEGETTAPGWISTPLDRERTEKRRAEDRRREGGTGGDTLGGVAYSGVCVEWVWRRIAATRWHFTCCLRPTPTLIFCGTSFFPSPTL